MSTYRVISPVNHDLKPYAVNDTIELGEAEAKILLSSGAIEGPIDPPKTGK